MRIATALFTLVSLLAATSIASAGSTSTDEARHQAGQAQYQMRASAISAMPAMLAPLPAVPSSTDDFRALAGARQSMTQLAAAPAMPAGTRVTSTDEARATAGQNLYTRSVNTMAVGAMNGAAASAAMR